MGKRNKVVHVICRRCGKHSFHVARKVCASCGFGRTSKRRSYAWHLWSK